MNFSTPTPFSFNTPTFPPTSMLFLYMDPKTFRRYLRKTSTPAESVL